MTFDKKLKIGILGGGQLGKMLLQSAMDWDLDISVLDNDSECPCSNYCSKFIKGDITDYDTVYNFAKNLDLITIEIENVSIEALESLEKEGKKVYPQPAVIKNIKNKCTQKTFFEENDIPTSPFFLVKGKEDATLKIKHFPVVNKVGVGGYDGKGVQIIRSEKDLEKIFDSEGIIEELIDFEKELAVIVARNTSGDVRCFPVVEMVFHPEANLVEYLFSPAHISNEVALKAEEIAKSVANSYGIIGLLAVEMFLTKSNEIVVNEVAPRPHNSGHHTLKANLVSQFEQHWRSILDLPLGNTKEISLAAMVNVLGENGFEGPAVYKNLEMILNLEGVFPYLYGKKLTKSYRKMGHVSILDSDFEKLKEKVNFVQENFKVISV
jgi:5-(carboxyamino)imidazole ribonucleotide synthase